MNKYQKTGVLLLIALIVVSIIIILLENKYRIDGLTMSYTIGVLLGTAIGNFLTIKNVK